MTFQVRDGSRDTSCGIFVLFNDLFLFFCLFFISVLRKVIETSSACVSFLFKRLILYWHVIFAPFLVPVSLTLRNQISSDSLSKMTDFQVNDSNRDTSCGTFVLFNELFLLFLSFLSQFCAR